MMQRSYVHTVKAVNEDWQDNFMNKVAPPSVDSHPDTVLLQRNCVPELLSIPFRVNELENVLKNTPNTSPRYDEISYSMLFNLPP